MVQDFNGRVVDSGLRRSRRCGSRGSVRGLRRVFVSAKRVGAWGCV